MTTTINYYGVNFVLCNPETIALIKEELDRDEWERSTWQAIQKAADEGDWDLYSDLYKDLYGIRPRW